MPNPKQPSRMGSDPLSWIRDTRQDEAEAQLEPALKAVLAAQEQPQAPLPKAPAAEKLETVTVEPPAPRATRQPRMETVDLSKLAAAAPAPVKEEPKPAPVPAETIAAVPGLALDAQQLAQLTALLSGAASPAKRGRPRTNFREVTKSSQEGLPEHWTRATFIVQEELLDTLKDYAYTQRLTIRDVMHEALSEYLQGKQIIRRRR